MKKNLKIIILLLVLSIINVRGVKAETFYEDNWISGVYANLVDGDFSKPQQMRFIRRKSDNKAVFCITPRETIYEDAEYKAYNIIGIDQLNISQEKFLRLSEIAYFGYGYKNHTSDNWYAVTQYMLWKEADSKLDIFFTDKFKGNRITKFESEINEINDLIKEYNNLPNIGILNLLPNQEYEIVDTNNALQNFEIGTTDGLEVTKIDNVLKIKTKESGHYEINLNKDMDYYNDISRIYAADKGQNIFVTGNISSIEYRIDLTVSKSKLEIRKLDSETLSNNRGNLNLEGAIYNLYDENNNVVTTLTTNNEGVASIDNLVYGNYTLKEIKAPNGYYLDNKIYNLNIDSEEEIIELKEDVIKANVIINKTLNNDGIIEKEPNVTFSIYDINDKLIDKITTDNNGTAKINLLYGKYKIVQENTELGYKKVDSFYINIDSGKDKVFNLEDNIIKTNLKIIKKDIDTNKNIVLSNTSFKIKDIINDEYLLNDNNEEVFNTDENGILNINIKGGKYILEEIKAPNGYILGNDISFTIDENTNIIDNTYELIFYNEKQYGLIKIIKNGRLLNDNLITLENVEFNIYALEDIITADETIYYKKGNLVDTIKTDIKGEALSKYLYIGKYYIEEKSTLENFIIDKQKYIVDLNNNLDNDLIIKELYLINQEELKEENEIKDEIKSIATKEMKLTNLEINNIGNEDKKEEINNEIKDKDIETIYPKTSNKDIYINTIICYLIFIGIMLILASLKHEK